MKKCSQCGFLNEDKLANCKVCNNILVNETVEKEPSIDDGFFVINPNAATKEPFEVTLFDKIVGGAATAAFVASSFLMVASQDRGLLSITTYFPVILVGILNCFFSNQMWKLSRKNRVNWFNNSKRHEPSDLHKSFRRTFNVLYLVAGIYSVTPYIF